MTRLNYTVLLFDYLAHLGLFGIKDLPQRPGKQPADKDANGFGLYFLEYAGSCRYSQS